MRRRQGTFAKVGSGHGEVKNDNPAGCDCSDGTPFAAVVGKGGTTVEGAKNFCGVGEAGEERVVDGRLLGERLTIDYVKLPLK